MIDHMERLILKGGPHAAPSTGAQSLKRGGIGSKSGPLLASTAKVGSQKNIRPDIVKSSSGESAPGDSSIKGDADGATVAVRRMNTHDDPFHDLPAIQTTTENEDGEDFFVGRQRNLSLDLLKEKVAEQDRNPNQKAAFTNRPANLNIRSISFMSDGSTSYSSPYRAGIKEEEGSGDSALLGVSQMLSLLRSQVTKPKHSGHTHRTLDDSDISKTPG